uniref:Putative secreted peptide n=1 Tax=Anopheles braziliensis TaxID=58242 RepID=A0A2M3ZQN0_9DIPT
MKRISLSTRTPIAPWNSIAHFYLIAIRCAAAAAAEWHWTRTRSSHYALHPSVTEFAPFDLWHWYCCYWWPSCCY